MTRHLLEAGARRSARSSRPTTPASRSANSSTGSSPRRSARTSQCYYRRLSSIDRRADGERVRSPTSSIAPAASRAAVLHGPDEPATGSGTCTEGTAPRGRQWTIVLGVEKAGMTVQLDAWFTDPLGIPHVALGGYASHNPRRRGRADDIDAHDRPAVSSTPGDHRPDRRGHRPRLRARVACSTRWFGSR